MYQNYYNQANLDRINNQIAELEKIKAQINQPAPITQNFQLAPASGVKYANSLDEVQREQVIGDTPFFSKDMSVVWVKNSRGGVKTYELNEIVPKDEKDIQIELLQNQIKELRREIHESNDTNVIKSKDTTDTEWNDETDGESIKEDKSSSIQRVSTSKKK